MRLQGKQILITGAGRGLGLAYARRLGREGARIIVAEIDAERGRDAETALQRDGIATRFIHADVADKSSVAAMAQAAGDGIDGVVCNAAWASDIGGKSFFELDVAAWDRMMAVNVRGTWLTVRMMAPRMPDGGSIVTVSSDAVLSGAVGVLHYVTSKSALIGMTRSLAAELGARQIRVNGVMPGLTLAKSTHNVAASRWENYARRQLIKRRQVPEDIEGVVAFLVSDDSRFMTGQMLCVDGGFALD